MPRETPACLTVIFATLTELSFFNVAKKFNSIIASRHEIRLESFTCLFFYVVQILAILFR